MFPRVPATHRLARIPPQRVSNFSILAEGLTERKVVENVSMAVY